MISWVLCLSTSKTIHMKRMHRDATYDSACVNDRRFGRLVNLQGEILECIEGILS